MADQANETTAPAQTRGIPKTQIGIVTSNKMQKTVVVQTERLVRHAKYKKYVKRLEKFKAHDERQECQIGDKVLVVETRPLSRDKRWRVEQILERAV
jgi:small subunit ribosomal protein S17